MRIHLVEYAIAERCLKSPTAHFTKTGRNSLIQCLSGAVLTVDFLAIPVSPLT